MLSLSLKWHARCGSVAGAFTSGVPRVFGLALTLVTFVLVVLVATFNSLLKVIYFLKKFPRFSFRGYGFRVRF